MQTPHPLLRQAVATSTEYSVPAATAQSNTEQALPVFAPGATDEGLVFSLEGSNPEPGRFCLGISRQKPRKLWASPGRAHRFLGCIWRTIPGCAPPAPARAKVGARRRPGAPDPRRPPFTPARVPARALSSHSSALQTFGVESANSTCVTEKAGGWRSPGGELPRVACQRGCR